MELGKGVTQNTDLFGLPMTLLKTIFFFVTIFLVQTLTNINETV